MPNTPEFFETQWFIPLLIATWCVITGFITYRSGWLSLAAKFRATKAADGEIFRFVSGSMGASSWLPVSYRNCLFFAVGESGFRISLLFIFRLLGPPLFIPWSQVESVEMQRYWFIQHAVVRILGSPIKIMVPYKAGQSIVQHYAKYSTKHAL